MLTAQQFGRAVQVTIIPPIGEGVVINPDTSPGAPQLRVSVRVSKGIGSPASCEVQVWNMSQADRDRAAGITRRIIDFSDQVGSIAGRVVFGDQFGDGKAEQVTTANGYGFIRVKAFYQGAGAPVTIFEGTTTRVLTPPARPDIITQITAGDGVIQDAAAITDRQWRSSVSTPTVLEYVIREVMGTELDGAEPGNFGAGLPPALREQVLPAGYDATQLFATDILDEFARVTNTEWWWDDGVVFWKAAGVGLDRPPLLLNTTPEKSTFQILDTPQQGEDNQIRLPLLLLPQLRPGWPVRIVGGDFRGDYYARAVEHVADNRGQSAAKTFATLARTDVLPFE
jgi:hypothetical protein